MKTTKFNTRKDMLEVIHNTYLYILDNTPDANYGKSEDTKRRLDYNGQVELGRKLAEYWAVKE